MLKRFIAAFLVAVLAGCATSDLPPAPAVASQSEYKYVIGPGDCLGEMSVIDGSPRSATALIVGVGTRALAIRGETFRRFVEERSHVSGKIIGVLANRLRQYVERSARPIVSAKTAQPQAQAS